MKVEIAHPKLNIEVYYNTCCYDPHPPALPPEHSKVAEISSKRLCERNARLAVPTAVGGGSKVGALIE